MIKGIILDVDGVIIGEKIGFNSPYPHQDVIARLRGIKAKGIPVILCTAKPHYAIKKVVNDAKLNNLHITDGGGVIIDPIDGTILESHTIEEELARSVVQAYLDVNVYTEAYKVNEYLLQKSQATDLTDVHTHILQYKPTLVDSLPSTIKDLEVVKIMPVARDEVDKARLEKIFEPFSDDLTLSWGVHTIALPYQFGIITAKDISKKQAAIHIAEHENIKAENLLGVGDSTSDWQFIEQCGYAATLENGTEELKKLIAQKEDKSCVGESVDKNGILDILDYFNL